MKDEADTAAATVHNGNRFATNHADEQMQSRQVNRLKPFDLRRNLSALELPVSVYRPETRRGGRSMVRDYYARASKDGFDAGQTRTNTGKGGG